MRVDVDFNQRDRHRHVVARVPGDQAARLTPGRRVYLYDPLERLWAEASVARINTDTQIAAFDVDWHSFADAEVTDLTIDHRQWFVGVPPSERYCLPASAVADNASRPTFRVRFEMILPGENIRAHATAHWTVGNSTVGTQAAAVAK